MGQSQRCARPGCRAWAMRGRDYCRAHQAESANSGTETTAAPAIGRRTSGARLRFEARIARALAVEQRSETLTDEIETLRRVLARVMAEEDDPARLAVSIPRIVDSVVRAKRAQHLFAAGASGIDVMVRRALEEVLSEMGLGGDR